MTGKRFPARGQDGFTLLEVMVALSIFTAGMVSIMALFVAGIALHREAASKTKAALVADKVMGEMDESIRKAFQSGSELPPAGIEIPLAVDFPGFRGVARVFPLEALPEQQGMSREVLVEVEILWKRGGEERKETFYSIFSWEQSYSEKVRDIIR